MNSKSLFSIGIGAIFSPPEVTNNYFILPVIINSFPYSVLIHPRSPECKNPSESIASFVFNSFLK
jgi:hypothetical protein